MTVIILNIVKIIILMSIIESISACFFINTQWFKKNEPKKYALLIGGGTNESDSFESFYKNIEEVYTVQEPRFLLLFEFEHSHPHGSLLVFGIFFVHACKKSAT